LAGQAEQRLFERFLEILRVQQLVKARIQTRTDSTHVLAAIRGMNRLERVIETLRAALAALATVAPEWVQANIPLEWVERYGPRAEDYRLPQQESKRTAYAEQVGVDGHVVLEALWSEVTARWLREIPVVETLRQVWIQNFMHVAGSVRWRDKDNLPPASRYLNSPYDTAARYSKKRDQTWLGYKVHLTETCDDTLPHVITHVETVAATTGDNDALPAIHEALEQAQLLPSTHLVDTSYVEAKRLVESRDDYGVDLFGPTPGNRWWQSQQGQGFDLTCFHIDWERQRACCPEGRWSSSWRSGIDHRGNEVVNIVFAKADCSQCRSLSQCTTAATQRRTLNVRAQPMHEALQAARQREHTDEFKAQYKRRAGIEGTISQGVRAFELRRSRYWGQAKTRLQHLAIATAMNLVRVGAWLAGLKPQTTKPSVFARVMAPLAP
jgi:transposase